MSDDDDDRPGEIKRRTDAASMTLYLLIVLVAS